MLISLEYMCQKYNFKPKGVLHVGAHLGEEAVDYKKMGIEKVVWVEGNEDLIPQLTNNLSTYDNQIILNYLVSNVDDEEYDFKISNNGQSSSILEMDKHLHYYPQINFVETKKIKSKRIDSIIKEHDIKIEDYDFLNLDIQGAELLALEGMGETLKPFKYIYTEVNTGELYKGCAKITEIDSFLEGYGFERVETKITPKEWGDALYIKKYYGENI